MKQSKLITEIRLKTARYYQSQLSSEARKYLIEQRGFTESLIEQFMLGEAKKHGLRDYLITECHYDVDICINAGVLKISKNGAIIDNFRKRIIYPIMLGGEVAFMTGRAFAEQEPKYLHLRGIIPCLYNEVDLSERKIYLAEGPNDCITAKKYGVPAVGLLGKTLKTEFVQKFNGCEIVYVGIHLYESGGVDKAMEVACLLGDKARIVSIPGEQDLNEYMKDKGEPDILKLLESAEDSNHFLMSIIPADLEPIKLAERMKPLLMLLARQSHPASAAILGEIKTRYTKLASKDIDAYAKQINTYRKEIEKERRKGEKDDSSTDDKCKYAACGVNIVEIVDDDGKPAFLIRNPLSDDLELSSCIEIDGALKDPPRKEKIPWSLPRAQEVMRHYRDGRKDGNSWGESVVDEIVEYLNQAAETESPAHTYLFAAWVLHTYFQEHIQYSPIINFFAVPERGKSRLGRAMTYISYRGVVIDAFREANIFRMATRFNSTLCFDVVDIGKIIKENNCMDILNNRYEKGARVMRVMYPDKGPFEDSDYFDIFGPTIINTNYSVDRILETRSLTITMPLSQRIFMLDIKPELGLPLREKLLALRARYFHEPLPDIPKPAPMRLGDITKPLMQIIKKYKPGVEEMVLTLIGEFGSKRKLDKAESLEAEVIRAVIGLRDKVYKGALTVSEITERLNQAKEDRFKYTPQRIGRVLQSLGYQKCRFGSGISAILFNENKNSELASSYGLDIPTTSETSEINLD